MIKFAPLLLTLLSLPALAQIIYYGQDKNGTPMLSNTQTQGRVFYQSGEPNAPSASSSSSTQSHYISPASLQLNTAYNTIQNANVRTLGKLLSDWNSGSAIVVAHFGDSHVQPGKQIAPVRQALQSIKGSGGRGMIFPYKIAKTYSQEDYSSYMTGTWRSANSMQQPPKIGVGVSGFVGVSADRYATFGFEFADKTPALGNINAIAYVRGSGTYELRASNGTVFDTKTVTLTAKTQLIGLSLPNTERKLDFSVARVSDAGSFELHGVSLDNANTKAGVTYHNLGVGGAAFKSIMQQQYFHEQFATLDADLVILDWGTNDILYTNSIPDDMEATIRSTISKVRATNPTAAILLTSVQETRYKGSPTTVAANYSTLVRQIAQSEDVLFWDWYAISGGSGSMRVFQDNGYANPKDSIHLNSKGATVKGELLAWALIQALQGN